MAGDAASPRKLSIFQFPSTMQPLGATPRPVWNPDVDNPHSFFDDGLPVPAQEDRQNAFKTPWESFLRHMAREEPFPWDLLEGAKGAQLAELGYEAWEQRTWLDVPALTRESARA